ncbi:MAG TPA: DUF6491 family protein [Steroidobacteraceae bacterium]
MKVRAFFLNAAACVVAAVAVGCATTSQSAAARAKLANLTKLANLPGRPGCFWKSNFQGDWTVLNDSTMIVRAPLPQDAYVIKLFEPVFDLGFRQRLGFIDREHAGQICNDGDDYLEVPGGQPPRVPITAVRALTSAEQSELLQAAGLPEPRSHTAAQTAPAKN